MPPAAAQPLLLFAFGDKVSLSVLELLLPCLSLLSGWEQATVTFTLKTRRVDDPRDATERPTSPLFILKDGEERCSHDYFRKEGHLPTTVEISQLETPSLVTRVLQGIS